MSLSPEFKLFATKALESNPDYTNQEVIDLYDEYKGTEKIEVPDPKSSSEEELVAFNSNYIKGKTNSDFQQEEYQARLEQYSGLDGITTPDFTGMIQEAQDSSNDLQPIDIVDILKKWANIDKYEIRGEGPGEIKEAPTGFDKVRQMIYTGYRNRKEIVARTGETALEEGGLAPAARWVDWFPSKYRGLKQSVGLEDFNIPIIDDIARVTGGISLSQQQREQMFLDYLKENGYVAEAATLTTLNSVSDTLQFLQGIKMLGMTRGASAVKDIPMKNFNVKQILSVAKNATKIAAFNAMTSENVTMKERAEIFAITAAYAITPAGSGALKNPFLVKTTDFLLNTAISAGKKDGYIDIINNPEMDEFEKIMAAGNLLGHDIVFSAITKSWKKGSDAQRAMAKQISDTVIDGFRPTSQTAVRFDAEKPFQNFSLERVRPLTEQEKIDNEFLDGPDGLILRDKANVVVRKSLEATEKNLTDDLAKIEKEAEVAAKKPSTEDVKPVEPKPEEVVETNAIDNKAVQVAVKQSVVETIRDNANKKPFDQAEAVQIRMEQLGEVLDAPSGTKVKTVINRINNIRQGKPSFEFKQKEYYKTLEQVSRQAAKGTVKDVSESMRILSEFARENLPYRQADQVIGRMQKVMQRGVTAQEFTAKATDILDRATGRLQAREAVGKVQDMTDRVDMTEAEMLRIVLKERVDSGRVARRAAIENIVTSQKAAQDIINDMPKSEQRKVINQLRNIAKSQTNEGREKALIKFEERVNAVLDTYELSNARKTYNNVQREAKALIKSRELTPAVRESIEEITVAVDAGKAADTLSRSIKDAVNRGSVEEVEAYKQLADFFGKTAVKPFSEMTAKELNEYSLSLNSMIYRMNSIKKEKKDGKKTAGEKNAGELDSILATRKPRDLDKPLIAALTKLQEGVAFLKVRGEMIPRNIAESMDLYTRNGPMEKMQTRLELSTRDQYEVEYAVTDIVRPFQDKMVKLNFNKNGNKSKFEVTDMDGNKIAIRLGVADRSRIYMAYRDPGTWEVSQDVGFVRSHGNRTQFKITNEQYQKIEEYMNKNKETEISESFIQAYNELGKFIDERSMELNGFGLTIPNYTGPRIRFGIVDGVALHKNEISLEKGEGFNEAFVRQTAESNGLLKSRTGSDKPLFIYNPSSMLQQVSSMGAYYYARASVLRELNHTMQYMNNQGFQDKYRAIGRQTTYKAFRDYVNRLNERYSPRKQGKLPFDKIPTEIIDFSSRYLGKRALAYNTKTPVIQIASLPTAMTAIPKKYQKTLYEAFGKGAASIEEMSSKSTYLRARFDGRTGHIYSDKALTKADQRGMGGIRLADGRVIGSIYRAMEQKVKDERPSLRGEEFNRQVEREVIDVIFKSQPSFEDVSRPEGALTTNPLLKMAFVFSSQRNKNYYILSKNIMSAREAMRRGELQKDELLNITNAALNMTLANLIVTTINSTQNEIMEEIFIWRYGDLPSWYEEKTFGEKMAFNFMNANLGNAGASLSLLSTAIQGFEIGGTAADSIAKDAKRALSVAQMSREWQLASKIGEGERWWDAFGKDYLRAVSEVSNLAIQPATGVNVANVYKYFVEQPLALVERMSENEQREFDQLLREFEREQKEWLDDPDQKEYEETENVIDKINRALKNK